MADKFPGPNYNKLVNTDPQIVKIDLDKVEWGSRSSILNKAKPSAPEMTIKHVSGRNSG